MSVSSFIEQKQQLLFVLKCAEDIMIVFLFGLEVVKR